MGDSAAARFWDKVDKSGDCWLWLGAIRGDTGYGEFWLNRRSFQAHRVSYQLTHNVQLESNQLVLHRCNNRRCVNPNHLYMGDYKDNFRDMVQAGWTPVTGERHGRAKLTPGQAIEIRALYTAGGVSQRELARRYNVSQRSIAMVLHNITFQEVN